MAGPTEAPKNRQELSPELIDNTIDIEKIPDLKVTQTGILTIKTEGGQSAGYRWYKISYKGIPLNIPIFQKPGLNIVYQISETFKRMTKESCREKLAGLWKTCSIEDGRNSTGRNIQADERIIMDANEFSNFVGINIVGGEYTYQSIRDALAKNGIYPGSKTMLVDFVEWWNSISTEKLFIQDTKKEKK